MIVAVDWLITLSCLICGVENFYVLFFGSFFVLYPYSMMPQWLVLVGTFHIIVLCPTDFHS